MSARTISVKKNILEANSEQAAANRKLLEDRNIRMLNIMSSPGSARPA